MKFKKLFEGTSDGWEFDNYELDNLLDDLYNLNYEINNCVRGAYTNCITYKDLGEYMQRLGDRLISIGEEIADTDEDDNLDEDTVKLPNGKWVNVGKEGKHDEFNTKKEADAQRRAMFVNR